MRRARGRRGMVMIETLLAFMPLFMLFLGIVQYALLAAAQLVVKHAAVAGARAASVVLPDDPARYEGAELLELKGRMDSGAGAGDLGALAVFALDEVPALPTDSPSRLHGLDVRAAGPRMAPIRNAVYGKLAAIVPARALAALGASPGTSVLDALGRTPALRLIQAPFYLPITTAITFPRAPGARELYEERVAPSARVTVRVTHLVTCTVPLVSLFMCETLTGRSARAPISGRAAQVIDEVIDELGHAPAAELQPLLAGVRAAVLQAEATMPLQLAPYRYPSAREAGP